MPTEPLCIDEVLVTDGGRRVGWLARGPDDGVPILYLHGCPGSRLEQRLIPWETLSRFGARLISVDRPGYGNTDPLGGERSARVGDVLSVCDALSIGRFPVMGVSAGGSNVLTLAAIAPDRVTRVVSVSGQMPYDDDLAIATLDAQQARELRALRAGRNAPYTDRPMTGNRFRTWFVCLSRSATLSCSSLTGSTTLGRCCTQTS